MGHISIDYDGPPCVCGARGCIEAFMTALDRESIGKGKWLFEDLELGTPGSAASLDAAASYLAAAVQTVSRLFRPSSFLFVAQSEAVAAELARRVGERLEREVSSFDEVRPRLLGRAYDASLAQHGAADLVIDSFLG
jgi:predicted NBD/HSP70 family sugar kinase